MQRHWKKWGRWLKKQRRTTALSEVERARRDKLQRRWPHKKLGLTQEELAARIRPYKEDGSYRSHIATWEVGRKKPPNKAICAAFDVALGLESGTAWDVAAISRIGDAEWAVVNDQQEPSEAIGYPQRSLVQAVARLAEHLPDEQDPFHDLTMVASTLVEVSPLASEAALRQIGSFSRLIHEASISLKTVQEEKSD